MNNVRTVSDTKRAFYAAHSRPINSIYRRVVEELMVEMHLLSVNADFSYDTLYALGMVTSFDRFMAGYQPERDKTSIFEALCRAVDLEPQKVRQDAEQLKATVDGRSLDELKTLVGSLESSHGDSLGATLHAIASNKNYKYSRLMGIGTYTLVETVDAEVLKDKDQREALFQTLCEGLNIGDEKLQKDLDLYRSNLDKMEQAQAVMRDILAAERKKREERAQAKASAATVPEDSQPSQEVEDSQAESST